MNSTDQPLLPFISDQDFMRETKKVIDSANSALNQNSDVLYSNVVDPFSAIFDSTRQGITLSEWLIIERNRQVQKTIQNALGVFHQEILGSVPGWESLGTGKIVDIVHEQRNIVAEIKNKHNTTKGNHKKEIYDDIKAVISLTYPGCVGYYVEIIPKTRTPYDHPFTPSDNTEHNRRAARTDIRIIDGKSFYHIVTGIPNAIDLVYKALPVALARILNNQEVSVVDGSPFAELFYRAYNK